MRPMIDTQLGPASQGDPVVFLVPIEGPDANTLLRIAEHLSPRFGIPVAILPHSFDHRHTLCESRGQYSATEILRALVDIVPSPNAKLVAITDLDLYIPVLHFVFGEAQLSGNVAIVSSHRLRGAFYGLSDGPHQLLDRLDKEITHELGHTFGLAHCHNQRCVMRASNCVEEIDLKHRSFCRSCQNTLNSADDDIVYTQKMMQLHHEESLPLYRTWPANC